MDTALAEETGAALAGLGLGDLAAFAEPGAAARSSASAEPRRKNSMGSAVTVPFDATALNSVPVDTSSVMPST